MADLPGLPSNEELVKRGKAALNNRVKRELSWAGLDLIRNAENRPEIRNWPWNKSANSIVPRADMAIEQWKSFLVGGIVQNKLIGNFQATRSELLPLQGQVSSFNDQLIRNHTNFVTETKFCADDFCHMGMCYDKVTWDFDRQVPKFTKVGLLYVIRPSNSQLLEDDEWFIHVIQVTKATIKRRWGHLKNIDSFLRNLSSEEQHQDHDQAQFEDAVYQRVGIDRSQKREDAKVVLWQPHYRKNGKKGDERVRTVSPDDQDFSFDDDQEYPYDYCRENGKWMMVEGLREYKEKKAYASRGYTEISVDTQESESAARRTVENLLTTLQAPMFMPAETQQSATSNFSFIPGSFSNQRVDYVPTPPIPREWFEYIRDQQLLNEQRVNKPDFAINRDSKNQDSRTAREISLVQAQQNNAVNLVMHNWNSFNTERLRLAWGMTAQYKPKSMQFFFEGKISQLEEQALSNDFMITVATDAEMLNRELQKQTAIFLFQLFKGHLNIDQPLLAKRVLETVQPEWSSELWVEPAVAQAEALKGAVLEVETMLKTGQQGPIDPNGDHMSAAAIAERYLSDPQEVFNMGPEKAALVLAWGQQHAQLLSKQNPQAGQQAEQALAQVGQQVMMQLAALEQSQGQQEQKVAA